MRNGGHVKANQLTSVKLFARLSLLATTGR